MSKKPDTSADSSAPLACTFSDTDIAKAREWFQKGRELAAKKNYDYAIESYITGLDFWPEAVEEGHKPCRAAAPFRGPRKVSLADTLRYKAGSRDPKKAMLSAEALLAKDPSNIKYMEAIFKNAFKAGYPQTFMWIGELLLEAAEHEPKPNPERLAMIGKTYETFADRIEPQDPAMAIAALERAVQAMNRLSNLKPQDMEITTQLRDVAGKLTILKGKYDTAESFRESVQDSEAQRELHDRDRLFQSDQRVEQLIAQARKRYEENPTDRKAINELVEMLCKREKEQEENKAIEILLKAYKDTGEYGYKMHADDIRIAQFRRKARQLATAGDTEAARKVLRDQLRLELKVYKERTQQYPTDMRLRYQYGLRLFKAGRHDDAIPVLQDARSDPKTRVQCNLYIGRCFFEKGYHAQAIDTFKEALRLHETPDDELGKDLLYRLGRAYEEDGQVAEALKTYGQLIQWDYNYRNGEVRKRLDALKNREAT